MQSLRVHFSASYQRQIWILLRLVRTGTAPHTRSPTFIGAAVQTASPMARTVPAKSLPAIAPGVTRCTAAILVSTGLMATAIFLTKTISLSSSGSGTLFDRSKPPPSRPTIATCLSGMLCMLNWARGSKFRVKSLTLHVSHYHIHGGDE